MITFADVDQFSQFQNFHCLTPNEITHVLVTKSFHVILSVIILVKKTKIKNVANFNGVLHVRPQNVCHRTHDRQRARYEIDRLTFCSSVSCSTQSCVYRFPPGHWVGRTRPLLTSAGSNPLVDPTSCKFCPGQKSVTE